MTREQQTKIDRGGVTLIEVVVLLAVITVLAALILPANRSARYNARKLQCLNNIRNVALAVHNYSSANGGSVPSLTSEIRISASSGQGTMAVGWPVLLLPALDQAALLRKIRQNAAVTHGIATIVDSDKVAVDVFTCSDDRNSYRRPGGLNFVANAGFISSEVWGIRETATLFHQPYLINWKGSTTPPFRSTDGTRATGDPSPGNLEIALATGVFWRIVGDEKQLGYSSSLDHVSQGDGTSTTLLLVENTNAGPWYGTDVNAIGFGIRIPVSSTNHAPSIGTKPPYGEFDSVSSLNAEFAGSTFQTASAGSWINERATGIHAPRPSSVHVGGVNVIMADGSGRFLSETLDRFVYARLVTSNGVAYGEKELKQSAF